MLDLEYGFRFQETLVKSGGQAHKARLDPTRDEL